MEEAKKASIISYWATLQAAIKTNKRQLDIIKTTIEEDVEELIRLRQEHPFLNEVERDYYKRKGEQAS